ncbi:uncharacterized protein LOC106875071 [Octopus bimaculoides]|nr:uncharacterized protein LOC106875071 [Octopus bimaculoides]XP_014778522.1 uncharacterized protein LOC106875071 [Octopus bimaculoides]XP_052834586.1 uncharacterized protein LOC106875071 [Octopus bimaculoides]XP_052834587.1 uncharacterized protein LOC106875071 [Octopus bimaculoides]|eukprot:XP_014778521.1 PREDICTED: uncharacterized protein LOC106875071 [Octopus bimaculoides]
MSEACELPPSKGSTVQTKPDSVIEQMLTTVQDGEPEEKHCLSYECDIILECKVCRNLFRVMQSFLNHKKVNCLQYLISFDVPVPTKEKEIDKTTSENSRPITKEKSDEIPSTKEPSPDKTISKTVPKSKGKAESSETSQVKSSETSQVKSSETSQVKSSETSQVKSSETSQVKSSAVSPKEVIPVENNDPMKLRNSRKRDVQQKESIVSKKDNKDIVSQKQDSSHKKESSSQKKNVSVHKKDSTSDKRDSSTTKRQSLSEQKDTTSQKRNSSSHRRDSTPQKRDSSSHRRESSSHRRDSSAHKRDSSVHKRDSSSEKREITHRKDLSSEKRETSQHRRERRESISAKEKQSSSSEKSTPHKREPEKRGSLTTKKDSSDKKRHAPPRKVNTNLKDGHEKMDVSNNETSGGIEKMDVTVETRSVVAKNLTNQKGSSLGKMEIDDKNEASTVKQKDTLVQNNATVQKKDTVAEKNVSTKKNDVATQQNKDGGQVKETISEKSVAATIENRNTVSDKTDTTSQKDAVNLNKENNVAKNEESQEKSAIITRKKDSIPEKKDSIPEKKVMATETKSPSFHEKPFAIGKKVVIVEKKTVATETKQTSNQEKVVVAEKNDSSVQKKDMATETRSVQKKESNVEKKDMATETKSVEKKDSCVQKKDMATETKSVEKKDSGVEKKDMATETKSVQKKDSGVEKKDMAIGTRSVEKKDSSIQKKDMATETKSVDKKDSSVLKKDMATETKSVEKKDSSVQKKDMATETKSVEKKDSSVQKKDMATETRSVEKKDSGIQKKDMATETKSVERKQSSVQKKDMATETKDSHLIIDGKKVLLLTKETGAQGNNVVGEKEVSAGKSKENNEVLPKISTNSEMTTEQVAAVNIASTANQTEPSDKKLATTQKELVENKDADKKIGLNQDSNSKVLNEPQNISIPNTSELKDVNEDNKNDASDKLNPLIAGVLDAYQRFKDKTQSQPKVEDPASKANELDIIPDANDKNNRSEKKAEEPSATEKDAAADKSKPSGELDLDNKDLNDPERYELRNRLRCPDCGLELTNMTKLANHMSKHLAESKGHFVCPICQKETRLESFSDLILHLRDPHFLKDKQLLPMWRNLMKNCWVDEQDMSASFPVIEAVKRSERSNEEAVPEKNYKCPYCRRKPKILRYFSGLIGHLRSAHGLKRHQIQKIQTKLRKTSVVEVVHKKEIESTRRMLFKCSFCSKTFRKKATIKLHVKTCKKRTVVSVKETKNKKPRGRPKTFTKIVSYKSKKDHNLGERSNIGPMAASNSELLSDNRPVPLTTPSLHSNYIESQSAASRDMEHCVDVNLIQPVKLETFWVSKTPGKPSECVKSTVTNLEKLCQTPSKIFKSELTKIGNFQCYSCKRYYSVRQHFERHVQLCTQNRKIEEISDFQALRCLECNQSFSYLQHLKRHAAKHLGLDRFRCKLCNYSSYYWSDTKCHLTSHKDIDFRSPEYYIVSVSSSEYTSPQEMSNYYGYQGKKIDRSQTVLKRRHEPSQTSSGSGVVKTLVLTEQDGMLKVVSDPNQIAKMVGQQGSPPLKRLRIATDVTQSPAIMKALPEIQKAIMTPSSEKRESTLLTKNLPSPTLSDPTPSAEQFEPATDPDKQHQSWVRKPLKDPDAQPFTWDDDEEEETIIESTPVKASNNSNTTSSTSDSKDDTNKLLSTDNLKKSPNSNNTPSVDETLKAVSTIAVTEEKPIPDQFSEPPKLKKEIPVETVRCTVRDIKMEDNLQMPSISGPEVAVNSSSVASDTVMTVMFNENNDMILVSPNPSNSNSSSQGSTPHKEFFRVSHPVLSQVISSSQSSSSHSSYISTSHSKPTVSSVMSKTSTKPLNKPKTMWDMQHKNALRRLPTRGLVSNSTLSFPSASRRVTKVPDPLPTPVTATTFVSVTTESNSTSVNTSTTSSQSQSIPTTK